MSDEKTTEDVKIWEEIKDLKLELFGLPAQTVEKHAEKLPVPGKQLYIKLDSGAALVALETALGDKFTVEATDGYVVVRRKTA